MTQEDTRNALASLSGRLQVAYLVGCIEHARPACGANEVLTRAIELAWRYALNGSRDDAATMKLSAELDGLLDEDTDTTLVHIVSAAELVVRGLPEPNGFVAQVLNNIEAAIDGVDPQPVLGTAEERRWQEAALTLVQGTSERALTRDLFAGMSTEETSWLRRARSI